jgi:threonine/homoserine/homoserine lactone efflux protein
MTLEVWIAFAVLDTVLCFTPGPAVLFVVSTSLSRGTRAGLGGAWGIVACNTFYFLLSALGVAAVILASSRLFTALKWIGAAYLVWVGVKMVWSRARPAEVGADPRAHSPLAALASGFGVQAANPKALAFFVALLPQFIDAHSPVPAQVAILGLTSVVIEFGVLAFYVWLAARAGAYAGNRWTAWLQRVSGAFIVAAGARLALTRSA